MQASLQYLLHRARRFPLSRLPAALSRKGRSLVWGVMNESWARLCGTTISDRDLKSAMLTEAGSAEDPFSRERVIRGSDFFLATDRRDELVGRIRALHPQAVAAAIQAAEEICAHRFDLLGSGRRPLGAEIDWHRDFKSGYHWDPRTYYTRVRYGETPGVDVKVPWELSRFQHLATLGKAYWFTGDERYPAEFIRQVTHWIGHNPPEFGVNWACTMDIAIRAFNWLWGLTFFRQAPQVTPAFRRELARSLLAHGRHIMANLERGSDGITSNHYLADLVGLVGLGLACPAFREAETWRRFALEEMFREIERQVYSDGGDYESSIPYHRLVTEMFLAAAILSRQNGIQLPDAFCHRLESMLDFTRWYTKPNGLAPQVGDADDGRLHILAEYGTWDARDHRHLLATGGAFFGRRDLWGAAGEKTEEAFWLHGGSKLAGDRSDPPCPESRAFPETGIYLMRRDGFYLLIACNPVGTRGLGNHKHNDLLSFELHADGQDLLVDPGSFVYTADPGWRNHFRSTAVHNTVMIDGAEQNRFGEGGLFWLHADATPRCLAWETAPDEDVFAGEHDGYARLAGPVIHRREIRLRKTARTVEITDQLRGTGRHTFAWNFTLAPGVRLLPVGDSQWEMTGQTATAILHLEGIGPRVSRDSFRGEVVEAFVSPHYGIQEKTIALRFHLCADLPVDCRFRIEVR